MAQEDGKLQDDRNDDITTELLHFEARSQDYTMESPLDFDTEEERKRRNTQECDTRVNDHEKLLNCDTRKDNCTENLLPFHMGGDDLYQGKHTELRRKDESFHITPSTFRHEE